MKTLNYIEETWKEDKKNKIFTEIVNALNHISYPIKQQVFEKMNSRYLNKIPCLNENFNQTFLRSIAKKFNQMFYEKGNVIIEVLNQ